MSRHVVFGTGQVGRPLIELLTAHGHDVVAVNRSGRQDIADVQIVAGDASNAEFATAVCSGADAVYFCLNVTNYQRWVEEFPSLQRGVLTGATRAGARLVVLDNLYAYGPPRNRRLVESRVANPTSAKAMTRAAMTEELLDAHEAGRVEVAIGRASDYFGPGVTQSALGENVFGAALTGRAAQVMGNPDQPHSYSYVPDVASALLTLGTAAGTTGHIWHLPVVETRTNRQLVDEIYRLAGHKPRVLAAGRVTLHALGVFKPELREFLHTLYQFTDPWVVDDSRFRRSFGDRSTPVGEALASTLAWYRTGMPYPPR